MCEEVDTVSYRQTNTHTNPISHPDGDRAAADVVGRVGALLAQVTCSQQLAQVRHSWELEPQGKCSRWLGGWRCGRQAGWLAHRRPYTHTLNKNGLIQEKKDGQILSQKHKSTALHGYVYSEWRNTCKQTPRIRFGLRKDAVNFMHHLLHSFLPSACFLLSSSL